MRHTYAHRARGEDASAQIPDVVTQADGAAHGEAGNQHTIATIGPQPSRHAIHACTHVCGHACSMWTYFRCTVQAMFVIVDMLVRSIGGWVDGWTDGWMGGWMGG